MGPSVRSPDLPILRLAAWAGVSVVVLVAGVALAALTVTSTPFEALGNYQANTSLNFWTETMVASTTIPSPAPHAVSTTVASPSTLPTSSTNYGLNAGTVGHAAVEYTYNLYANETAGTEIELTFTIGTQTGATVTVKGYVETPTGPAPGGTIVINFYYDLGTAAGSSSLLVTTEDQTSQKCSAVGTCP